MYPEKKCVNMPILEVKRLRKKKGISVGESVKVKIQNDLKNIGALHIQKVNQKGKKFIKPPS